MALDLQGNLTLFITISFPVVLNQKLKGIKVMFEKTDGRKLLTEYLPPNP